jgi:hypothetical protein
MRPMHLWRNRTPAGVRCAHFPSVITIIMDHKPQLLKPLSKREFAEPTFDSVNVHCTVAYSRYHVSLNILSYQLTRILSLEILWSGDVFFSMWFYFFILCLFFLLLFKFVEYYTIY